MCVMARAKRNKAFVEYHMVHANRLHGLHRLHSGALEWNEQDKWCVSSKEHSPAKHNPCYGLTATPLSIWSHDEPAMDARAGCIYLC